MLSQRLIESDDFLSLSKEAQCLYMHLNLNADDDGILDNVGKVMGFTGCSPLALQELTCTGYIIPLLPNIYAIRDWHINNSIPKDRYKPSIVLETKRFLELSENKTYKLKGKIL